MPADTILLASPFFFPEEISTGRYNTDLVRELRKAGREVVVVALHPLYPSWQPAPTDAVLPGVRVLRGGAHLRYPRSTYGRRLLLELGFAWHAARELRRLRDSHTAIAVVPPSLFALLLPLVHRAQRRVLIVHDLQACFAAARGRFGRVVGRCLESVERYAFRHYDRVIFLSHAMRAEAVAAYGLAPERCVVRYPFSAYPLGEEEGTALADELPAARRHVIYAGALGEKQRPERLLELFAAAAERLEGVEFHVFSRGPAFDRVLQRFARSKVRFHDLVPEEHLAELYRRADVQVIPQAEGTGNAALPSKLPNVLASGAAVVGVCDGGSELARILGRAGGEVVTQWAETTFVAGLQKCLAATSAKHRRRRRAKVTHLLSAEFSLSATLASVLGEAA